MAELTSRVRALELAAHGTAPGAAAHVHVHVGGGGAEAASSVEAASREGEPDQAFSAAGGVFRRPARGAPRSQPDSAVKHYAVKAGNGTPAGCVGIYRSYGLFADAVRDPEVPWSGRGRLAWARRSTGESFATRRLAEDWLREQLGLAEDEPLEFFG